MFIFYTSVALFRVDYSFKQIYFIAMFYQCLFTMMNVIATITGNNYNRQL